MKLHAFMTLGLLAAAVSPIAAHAQTTSKQPAPPPQVCIGSKCVTSPAPSAATTPAATVASTSGPIKFHPGFYAYLDYSGGVNLDRLGNGQDGLDLQLINSLSPNDNVAGIAITIMWRTIDTGTTGPNYDWSVIDAYFNAVKAAGKRFWVRVQDGAYGPGASVASGKKMVPDWLIAKYGPENVMVNYSSPPRGVIAKRYSATVVNAYIAMFQAMAQRYDSDPMFEGVTMFEETAYGIDTSGPSVTTATPGADYSTPAMFTQLYNLMAGLRDPALGFKTANVQLPGNYLFAGADSAANWTDIFNHIQQYHMMIGGPDTWIANWTYPDLPFTGTQSTGPGAPAATNPSYYRALPPDEVYRGWWPGSTDWRGKILFGPDAELTDTGGYIVVGRLNPLPTLADLWQVRGPNLDQAQYFFFDIDYLPTGNYGGAPQQWSSGQYPWVQGATGINKTNPYQ